MYDPDRVRSPKKRKLGGIPNEMLRQKDRPVFVDASWGEAFTKIKDAVGKATKKKVLLTGELPSSQQ